MVIGFSHCTPGQFIQRNKSVSEQQNIAELLLTLRVRILSSKLFCYYACAIFSVCEPICMAPPLRLYTNIIFSLKLSQEQPKGHPLKLYTSFNYVQFAKQMWFPILTELTLY